VEKPKANSGKKVSADSICALLEKFANFSCEEINASIKKFAKDGSALKGFTIDDIDSELTRKYFELSSGIVMSDSPAINKIIGE